MSQEANVTATNTTQAPKAAPIQASTETKGPADGATTSTAKPAEGATSRSLKFNGKTYNVTEEQYQALAQKGMLADQSLKSVDVLKKSTQGLIDSIKSPEQFLGMLKTNAKELGIDPKDYLRQLVSKGLVDDDDLEFLASETHNKWLPRQKMTPEQIEQNKKLAEYEQLKKEKEARLKDDLTKQQQAQVQEVYQQVRSEVTKQVLADKTFPQTEGTIRSVVEKLRVMNKKGAPITVENVTKALGLVKTDFIAHQVAILDSITDDNALVEAIGKPRALRISRALIAALRPNVEAKPKAEKAEDGPRRKVTQELNDKYQRHPLGYSLTQF